LNNPGAGYNRRVWDESGAKGANLLYFVLLLWMVTGTRVACAASAADVTVEIDGLIRARTEDSVSLLGPEGIDTVRWTRRTRFSARVDSGSLNIANGTYRHSIPFSSRDGLEVHDDVVERPLPIPIHLNMKFGNVRQMSDSMASHLRFQMLRNWRLSLTPATERMPTNEDLTLSGTLLPWKNPSPGYYRLDVGTRRLKVRLVGMGRIFGIVSAKDMRPFRAEAVVRGVRTDGILLAEEIMLTPILDPLPREDPKLPRYLVIGDSISRNYYRKLHEALAGKANLHHPPENCEGTANGVANMHKWLGDYNAPGRGWDAISFNFGLWDAAVGKREYQKRLRLIIAKLERTGARLIWVTTTPQPRGGAQESGLLRVAQKPAEKKLGRMRLQNQWAAEVMAGHPDIVVCDLWQVVKDGERSVYAKWWLEGDVHFSEELAAPLARALAEAVVSRVSAP
jgi:hypothetical protein